MAAFTLKLKQFFRTVYNNKKISKDETEAELSEIIIIEEKERCINEILSTKSYMEDLLDKMVARLKAIHEYQHNLLFQTDNLVFLFVLHPRRREYFLTHQERNIKDILKAFDGDKVFKWTEECRKEIPIDYNFILCKGTLTNFQGSKGCVGELSVVNSDSEDYDVIRFKAEPIPNSRPYDNGKDEVYLHARWFKLAQLKYKFLVSLTLATIKTLNYILGFEQGLWDQDEENEDCLNILTHLCQINEYPSSLISISYEVLTISRHEELTMSEYSTAVRQLGCSNFKSQLESWSKYSFDIMNWTLKYALIYDRSNISALATLGSWYNKYLQRVKKGRAPKEGLWTFGPFICRLSKTMNRTAINRKKFVSPEVSSKRLQKN